MASFKQTMETALEKIKKIQIPAEERDELAILDDIKQKFKKILTPLIRADDVGVKFPDDEKAKVLKQVGDVLQEMKARAAEQAEVYTVMLKEHTEAGVKGRTEREGMDVDIAAKKKQPKSKVEIKEMKAERKDLNSQLSKGTVEKQEEVELRNFCHNIVAECDKAILGVRAIGTELAVSVAMKDTQKNEQGIQNNKSESVKEPEKDNENSNTPRR